MITISQPIIQKEEIQAVTDVLKSKYIVQGPQVAEFEKQFATLCGVKEAIAVNNGTAALHTALFAAGIGPGDEVITTPFTFAATAHAILMVGATVVFADIDEKTFNIDPAEIEKNITRRTKAVLTVNLFGQPADYKKIRTIAKQYKLIIIEDAAQSVGAEYYGKMSGALGDIACFSLYATKNIMTGEGGMVTTDNEEFATRARMFINHGQVIGERYNYAFMGFNYRMTDLLAALGITQLGRLQEIIDKRQKHAKQYGIGLSHVSGIQTPQIAPDRTHVFHQYTLSITNDYPLTRDKLQQHLEKKGIQSVVYYPKPLYLFPHLKAAPQQFPQTQRAVESVLSIPAHPLLTHQEINDIINTIAEL